MSRTERNSKAGRVVQYGPDFGNDGGAYRLCLVTGLITGITAATSSAGHIGAIRNKTAGKLLLVERAVAKWRTTTGATAAQEVGLDMIVGRSFTAIHTSGATVTLTGDAGKKRKKTSTVPPALGTLIEAAISNTGVLTAGTHTLDDHVIAKDGVQELADGATVVKKNFNLEFNPLPSQGPLVLAENEGLILRNSILMGTALVARVAWELDLRIVDEATYPQ